MKAFKELQEEISTVLGEGSSLRDMVKANKGRVGKPAIGLNGEEMEGSIVLDEATYLTNHKSGTYILKQIVETDNKVYSVYVNSKIISAIKKYA